MNIFCIGLLLLAQGVIARKYCNWRTITLIRTRRVKYTDINKEKCYQNDSSKFLSIDYCIVLVNYYRYGVVNFLTSKTSDARERQVGIPLRSIPELCMPQANIGATVC